MKFLVIFGTLVAASLAQVGSQSGQQSGPQSGSQSGPQSAPSAQRGAAPAERGSHRSPQSSACIDKNGSCKGWAAAGECQKNPTFMEPNCPEACNKCAPPSCLFPFSFNTIIYKECTKVGAPDGKPWCSTKKDHNGKHIKGHFSLCTDSSLPCKFPFIYKGVAYTECTAQDDPAGKPWCSTRTDNQNNHVRGSFKHCTESDSTKPISVLQRPTQNQSSTQNKIENIQNSLFPAECGEADVADRVVGGNEIPKGAYPWLVAVGRPRFGRFHIDCGGSLITRRHVLTAAHCWDYNSPTHLRLGEHNLKIDGDGEQDEVIGKLTIHEGYDENLSVNDIALITIHKNVTFNKNIFPVCLPMREDLRNNNFEGKFLSVVGWGDISEESFQSSPVPLEAKVRVPAQSICEKAYSTVENVEVSSAQLCAGGNGKDSCQGDSGGPLNYLDKNEGRYYLAGITSAGVGCARPDYPGVYVRVGAYIDWIQTKVQESFSG